MVFEDRILGNTELQKTIRYVNERPNILRPSRQEVKHEVWKYIQNIVIGLYAVCGHLLDNQDRTLSLIAFSSFLDISFLPKKQSKRY